MKILFFGLGSIGQRHARLLQQHFDYDLYAFRSDPKAEPNQLGIKEIFALEEIDSISPDVAFITNPTDKHLKYASFCAKKGIHLFIEKPLSHSMEKISDFSRIVKEQGITVYVAYCLRFHPVIRWLKEHLQEDLEKNRPLHVKVNASSYLPDWRPGIDHLQHYSAYKGRGGGVIMELSHEFDYLHFLLGKIEDTKVNAMKLSDVTVDANDFADVLFNANGTRCNLHIDFHSRLNRREIILDFLDHTIVADLISNKITIIREPDNQEVIEFDFERDEMYLSQLKYFFSNLGNQSIMNGLDEALDVFKIVSSVNEQGLVNENVIKTAMVAPKNILITICARGGSKGVKDKNIRELSGKPLISFTIETAKRWGKAKRIICSTDSNRIADTALKHGAEVPFIRPVELATDTIGKVPVIRHALRSCEKKYGETYDIIIDLDVTSPVRTIEDLNKCMKTFLEKQADVLFSVVEARKNPYFNMVELNKEGYAEVSKKPAEGVFRRQDAPKTYDLNASIYFFDRKFLLDEKNDSVLSSKKTAIHIMDQISAVDIDNELDFKFIEFLTERGFFQP